MLLPPASIHWRQPLAIRVAYDREELKLGDRVKATATLSYGGPGTFMVIDKYSLSGRQITLYFGRLEKGARHVIEYTLTPRFPIRARTPASGAYEYYTPDSRGSGRPSTLRVLEEF